MSMFQTTRNALYLAATLALLSMTSTSEAAWPRYRVSSSYSLPTAPQMRPMMVYPTERYLQANPTVMPATYGQPMVPNVMAPGNVPANMPPSLLAPPQVTVPNTTFYPQTYNAPLYNQPGYAQPTYNQPAYTPYNYNQPATTIAPPTTSYYNPSPYPAYQQPRPIQPYTGAVQPYGGFYQPTRPSTFYSPTPNYYPQQPVFGQY